MYRTMIVIAAGLLWGGSAESQTAVNGCLGAPVQACIAQLSTSMTDPNPYETQSELRSLDDVDVNGKSIGTGQFTSMASFRRFRAKASWST
jgi:hypothetical protein